MALTPDVEQAFALVNGRVPDDIIALLPSGDDWVNFVPEVDPDHEVPPRSLLATIFSNRGHAVPMATWTASDEVGRGAVLGIEHGAGPSALAQLAERGSGLPPGWRKVSDHARRGLVVSIPADADRASALRWLLEASARLSQVPLTGSWLARTFSVR